MASSSADDFYQEIKSILMEEYNYTEDYIEVFRFDVYDAYEQGKSISEVIFEIY